MVSLALIMGTIGTALASPLYPIYQTLWHLLPSQITYIFVAYMFGCLATLLFLGRASNSFGFLKVLQIGICFAILGLSLSAFAPNMISLAFARFIIGIASGLINTSAMLGLVLTIPDAYKKNAAQFSSIITVIGFGLGPLIGGLIAQFFPKPLITPYLPIILGAIVCLFGLFNIRVPQTQSESFSVAPHLELPQSLFKPLFYIAGFTAFSAFASFSLFASLAPSFVKDAIPWHGPLVSGIAISSILLVSAIIQFFAKNLLPKTCIQIGLSSLILSYVLLALCMTQQWGFLFFISDILIGVGHGLGLMGAFSLIHLMTNLKNRAAVMSTYLFIGYLGTIIPIIGVGFLADYFGFITAILTFCITIGLLCLWLIIRYQQQKQTHLPHY
ncbi:MULTISPECIES: MFS transporter [unclassified Acinetobacter]|uniref:MFS transporter n=1 Tax=unclassified Acinetobacter TaxID=196816 RepID=UPI002934FA6C|nr:MULTISPECIES: MFS transporter [unclassified Acinetobacter]WOE33161.1 MFS transporter [Acinetobacter sp. SAAs470]WOE39823.1 MFS transporter [Acinetobacter sp. SAAs474]